MQDEAVIVVNEKRGACSLNLRGLLSDVKRLTERSEGSKEAMEAHDELSARGSL